MMDRNTTSRGLLPAGPGGRHLLILVAVVGLTVTFSLFLLARKAEQARLNLLFEQYVSVTMQLLSERVDRYEGMLHTLQTLFTFSEGVTSGQFAGAAGHLLPKYPEVIALEWVQRVSDQERRSVEAELKRSLGMPEFEFHEHGKDGGVQPASVRPEYWPILHAEPFPLNRVVLGYDLKSAPTAPTR